MELSRFLRKIPLWLVPVLFVLGLGLIWVASLIGLGGKFYAGDILVLIGFVVYLASVTVGLYGYLYPAMRRWSGRLLGIER